MAPQLPLFGPPAGALLDDQWGRITYTPGFLPAAEAARWFEQLRHGVAWAAERRRMYDRELDVPRLMASFRLDTGGGSGAGSEPGSEPPPAILAAAARVREATGVVFDSGGLNLYRDGRDSVAPHNDHLYEIAAGFPIALLSLGATRRMTVRAKPPRRRVLQVDLEAGSLLVMSYETQLHYTHAVPKTDARVGERISLAFRVRPARRRAGGGRYR